MSRTGYVQVIWRCPVGDKGWLLAAVGLVAAVGALTSCAAEAAPETTVGQVSIGERPPPTSSQPPEAMPVVHDGDEVVATGRVLAEAGKPARFCAPAPTTGMDPTGCVFGVPIAGLTGDLPDEVTLRGKWRAGTFEVIRQEPAPPDASPPAPAVPCQPPAGGWQPYRDVDSKELHRYVVEEHPEDFRQPWVAWPNGFPSGNAPTEDMLTQARVMVVEVVHGDVAEARKALEARYTGNLCVVPAGDGLSIADQEHVRAATEKAIEPFLRDPKYGVYATSAADKLTVDLVMLTPDLVADFAALPMALIHFNPWLRPA
ncbi:hypothetical protein JOD54_002829 [Actinokineospora baliensis]|uniref:hypothetical protein n=1 Tax=Actinokineospora baliensis TaxID=547056 RepID=UPI001957D97C|nr:hypothetical protein [Actinokineospora baliensis]MBM7772625.1 hypothetical protein [Actinokineospora baliensis]